MLSSRVSTVLTSLQGVSLFSLKANLTSLMDSGPALRIGTACSGTDVVILVVQSLLKVICQSFVEELTFQHVFSCERDPTIQQFILQNHNPKYLFGDVMHMGRDVALDLKTSRPTEIPSVDGIVVGQTPYPSFGVGRVNFLAGIHCCDLNTSVVPQSTKPGTTLHAVLVHNCPCPTRSICLLPALSATTFPHSTSQPTRPAAWLPDICAIVCVHHSPSCEGVFPQFRIRSVCDSGAASSRT